MHHESFSGTLELQLIWGLIIHFASCILKWHMWLTHWGRAMHICVSKITTIGSDNGLSHGQRQAIIWTNAGILLIGPLRTNVSEILIEIHTFSYKKMHFQEHVIWKMAAILSRPQCANSIPFYGMNEWVSLTAYQLTNTLIGPWDIQYFDF